MSTLYTVYRPRSYAISINLKNMILFTYSVKVSFYFNIINASLLFGKEFIDFTIYSIIMLFDEFKGYFINTHTYRQFMKNRSRNYYLLSGKYQSFINSFIFVQ